MRADLAERLTQIAPSLNADLEFDPDYTGRGMGSRGTAAVIGDNDDVLVCMMYLARQASDEEYETLLDDARGFRREALGQRTVIY